MPTKTTAYLCEYRCGRKATTKKSDMVKHEQTCYANPVRRACKSCKHDAKYLDDNGAPEPYLQVWWERDCKVDARGDAVCIADCPQWEAKEAYKPPTTPQTPSDTQRGLGGVSVPLRGLQDGRNAQGRDGEEQR